MNILFLRSAEKPLLGAFVAGALKGIPDVYFEQYPKFPENIKYKLDKYWGASRKWDDLNYKVVPSFRQVRRKIESGAYDLVLIVDHDCKLFRYVTLGFRKKVVELLKDFKRMIHGNVDGVKEVYNFFYSLSMPIENICSKSLLAVVDLNDWICITEREQEVLGKVDFYFKRELPYNRLFVYYQNRPSPWRVRRDKLLVESDKILGVPLGIEDEKYFSLKKNRSCEKI